jgi:hypothetical protein
MPTPKMPSTGVEAGQHAAAGQVAQGLGPPAAQCAGAAGVSRALQPNREISLLIAANNRT